MERCYLNYQDCLIRNIEQYIDKTAIITETEIITYNYREVGVYYETEDIVFIFNGTWIVGCM